MTPQDLTPFQHGFFEAMFFTNFGTDDGDLAEKGFSDLSPATIEKLTADCDKFLQENKSHILRVLDTKPGRPDKYSEESAGRDFWFTRNHHGVGFWDRGLGEVGEALTKASQAYPEVTPYLGDDGRVYL